MKIMKIIITDKQKYKISQLISEQGVLPDISKEERIAELEKRKKHIEKLVPKIISYFNDIFGDEIYEIKSGLKGIHYGMEKHSMKVPKISFYFSNDDNRILERYKKDIRDDIKNLFNIDMWYYGVPLEIEFYKMNWKEF